MEENDVYVNSIRVVIVDGESFLVETRSWERSARRMTWLARVFVGLMLAATGYGLYMLVVDPLWWHWLAVLMYGGALALWVRLLHKSRAHLEWIFEVRREVRQDLDHMKAVVIEVAETGEWAPWMVEFPHSGRYPKRP